jgi:hypothetical protein
MDFIIDIPLSDGCDQCRVIIDHFTKMEYFIVVKNNEKEAEDGILVFADEI